MSMFQQFAEEQNGQLAKQLLNTQQHYILHTYREDTARRIKVVSAAALMPVKTNETNVNM